MPLWNLERQRQRSRTNAGSQLRHQNEKGRLGDADVARMVAGC
jgi:hypothetical protein